MAEPTPVNGEITDAVTQSNVSVVASAPSMAMGSIFQTLAHSTGILFENATNAQNQAAILAQAATTQGVMQIYSNDKTSDAISVASLLNANEAQTQASGKGK